MHIRARLEAYWTEPQHRNAAYLMLNTLTGAAAGLLFWVVLARFAGLPPYEVGIGYAIVALGTTVGLLAKGGLDVALLRTVPGASRRAAVGLLWLAIAVGIAAALALTAVFAVASWALGWDTSVASAGWALVAAIGALLAATWLQDAYFLAASEARWSFFRNLVFSAARLLLPLPIVAAAIGHPVALTWAIALAASGLAAAWFAHRLPIHEGREVPRREFVTTAVRNLSGGAAEFLPGLLLAPLVFARQGASAAAYFGIAWTAASLLFVISAAISRVALTEMMRSGAHGYADAIRKSVQQHAWTVLPAAVVGVAIAPYALLVFGADYAQNGSLVLMILCASILVVAPFYLYLAVLRARERPVALLLFPLAMVALLFTLAPLLGDRYGLPGVAAAWTLANAPFGVFATLRLRQLAQEVNPVASPQALHRAPHAE